MTSRPTLLQPGEAPGEDRGGAVGPARGQPVRWGLGVLTLSRIWLLAAATWSLWGLGVLVLGGLSSSANFGAAALVYLGLWVVGVYQWWFWQVRHRRRGWRDTTGRQWLHFAWLPLTWMGLWLMGASAGVVAVLGVLLVAVLLSGVRLVSQGASLLLMGRRLVARLLGRRSTYVVTVRSR